MDPGGTYWTPACGTGSAGQACASLWWLLPSQHPSGSSQILLLEPTGNSPDHRDWLWLSTEWKAFGLVASHVLSKPPLGSPQGMLPSLSVSSPDGRQALAELAHLGAAGNRGP